MARRYIRRRTAKPAGTAAALTWAARTIELAFARSRWFELALDGLAGLPDDLISALETRAIWAKFGF